MDKYSTMRRAARMLGERDIVEGSATAKDFEDAYEIAMRRCNGRHDWTFARIIGREVERDEDGSYALPPDCMRVITLQWGDGRKLSRPRYGVRESDYARIVKTDERGDEPIYVTYTSDLIKAGSNAPGSSPLFEEAVALTMAAEAAGTVTGFANAREGFMAQAEEALREAIIIDRRQDWSNDQDGAGEFYTEGGSAFGGGGRCCKETHYC